MTSGVSNKFTYFFGFVPFAKTKNNGRAIGERQEPKVASDWRVASVFFVNLAEFLVVGLSPIPRKKRGERQASDRGQQ